MCQLNTICSGHLDINQTNIKLDAIVKINHRLLCRTSGRNGHTKIENGVATSGKVKTSYYHDSATVRIENLCDLYERLAFVRQDPNAFIIRAAGIHDAQRRVLRRLSEPENFKEEATAWVCLDFDKYEVPPSIERTSQDAIEYLIETILPAPFRNVSYIYQWSSSAGLS